LDRDDLDVVDVQEVSRPTIGIDFLFINLKSDSTRIVIAFRAIIHCTYNALTFRELRGNGFADIGGKGSYAALTREMIADEGYLLNGGGDFHGPHALSSRQRARRFVPAAAGSVTYRFRYAPSYRQSGSDRLAGGPF
jgi:hypothetical protein